jgi:hypothetical protein
LSDLQNEIIGFAIVTVVVLLLALLTIKMEKKYKNKDKI